MLEFAVERLLNRFLAPYLSGISKENLKLGIWNGDLLLENLLVKPEVADVLELPFSILEGRVKRVRVVIPWASFWSKSLILKVEGVTVLLNSRNRKALSKSEIIEELRKAKMQQIEFMEEQQEARRHLQDGSAGSSEKDSSYFLQMAKSIFENLQIEVSDVHISYYDENYQYDVGGFLEKGIVMSPDTVATDATKEKVAKGELVNQPPKVEKVEVPLKILKLSRFGIFYRERNNKAPACTREVVNWLQNQFCEHHDLPYDDKTLDPSYSMNEGKMPSIADSSTSATAGPQHSLSAPLPVNTPDPTSASKEKAKENGNAMALVQNFSHATCGYFLHPITLDVMAHQNREAKELHMKIELKDSHQGIVMTRTQLQLLESIFKEMNETHLERQCILIRAAGFEEVDLSVLRVVMEKKFNSLFWRKQSIEAGLEADPLTPSEEMHLQRLYDVIDASTLVRWRFVCRESINEIIEVQVQKQKLKATAAASSSWWNWATFRGVDTSSNTEKDEADTLLTEAEKKIIIDSLEVEAVQQIMIPRKYSAEFKMAQLTISLVDNRVDEDEKPSGIDDLNKKTFLAFKLFDLHTKVNFQSKVDRKNITRLEWCYTLHLRDFSLWHYDEPLMSLDSCGDAEKSLVEGLDYANVPTDVIGEYLEVRYDVGKDANVLGVVTKLRPVLWFMNASMVDRMISFFWMDDPPLSSSPSLVLTETIDPVGTTHEPLVGMILDGGDDQNLLYDSIQFDIFVAAPIITFDTENEFGAFQIQLGHFYATSNGPALVDNISANLKLSRTQITHKLPSEPDNVHFLHPASVEIKILVKDKKHFEVDLHLDSVYLNVSTRAAKLIKSAINTFSDGIEKNCLHRSRSIPKRSAKDIVLPDASTAKGADELSAGAVVTQKDTQWYPTEKQIDEAKVVNHNDRSFKANFHMKTFGVSIEDGNGIQRLNLEAIGIRIGIELRKNLFKEHTLLQTVTIKDPSSGKVLFFTIRDVEVGSTKETSMSTDSTDQLDSFKFEYESSRNCVSCVVAPVRINWHLHSIQKIIALCYEYGDIMKTAINKDSTKAGGDVEAVETDVGVGSSSSYYLRALSSAAMLMNADFTNSGASVCDATADSDHPGEKESHVENSNISFEQFMDDVKCKKYAVYGELSKEEEKGMQREQPTFTLHLHMKGASLCLWKDDTEFARLSNEETVLKGSYTKQSDIWRFAATSANGSLIIDNQYISGRRCYTSSLDSKQNGLLTVQAMYFLRNKNTEHVSSALYIAAHIEQFCYIYYHKHIGRILKYLDDGILGAFIVSSVDAVKNAANSKLVSISLVVESPLFILPDDKSVIPSLNKSNNVESQTSGSDKNMMSSASDDLLSKQSVEVSKDQMSQLQDTFLFTGHSMDTQRLDRYICMELGHMRASLNITTSDTPTDKEAEVESNPEADISLNIQGMKISIESNRPNDSIKGEVVPAVDATLAITYRDGYKYNVSTLFSSWTIQFTQDKMTFIIDVLNENILGLGYTPRDVYLSYNQASELDVVKLVARQSSNSDGKSALKYLDTMLAAYTFSFEISQFQIIFLNDFSSPLASISLNKNCIKFSLQSFLLYSTSNLSFISESFIFEVYNYDKDSVTVRRLAECCYMGKEAAAVHGDKTSSMNLVYPLEEFQNNSVKSTINRARRPVPTSTSGITRDGSDDDHRGLSSKNRDNVAGISIFVENGLSDIFLTVDIVNASLFCFTTEYLLLFDWALQIYYKSTYYCYPQPLPTLIRPDQPFTDVVTYHTDESSSTFERMNESAEGSPVSSVAFDLPNIVCVGGKEVTKGKLEGDKAVEEYDVNDITRAECPLAKEELQKAAPKTLLDAPTKPRLPTISNAFLKFSEIVLKPPRENKDMKPPELNSDYGLTSEISSRDGASNDLCLLEDQIRVASSTKVLNINLNVNSGRFILYTASIEAEKTSVIDWSCDFVFSAQNAEVFTFQNIDIYDARVARLDVEKRDVDPYTVANKFLQISEFVGDRLAQHDNPLSPKTSTTPKLKNWTVRYSPLPFNVKSQVLFTERIEVLGSGSYGGAAALQQAKPIPLESTAGLSMQSESRDGLLSSAASLIDHPPESVQPEQETNMLLQLDFDIPSFYIRLSCKDLALLWGAVRTLMYSDSFIDQSKIHQSSLAYPQTAENDEKPELSTPIECTRRQMAVAVAIRGLNLTLLDDLRATVHPVFRLEYAVRSIAICYYLQTGELDVQMKKTAVKMEYLNLLKGIWEPFVERCQINMHYKMSQNTLCTSSSADSSDSMHRRLTEPTTSEVDLIIKSSSPLLVNFTPQLAQLAVHFLPSLLETFNTSYSAEGGTVAGNARKGSTSSSPSMAPYNTKGEVMALQTMRRNAVTEIPTIETRRFEVTPIAPEKLLHLPATENNAFTCIKSTDAPDSSFRYANLTGVSLYAFTLVAKKNQVNTNSTEFENIFDEKLRRELSSGSTSSRKSASNDPKSRHSATPMERNRSQLYVGGCGLFISTREEVAIDNLLSTGKTINELREEMEDFTLYLSVIPSETDIQNLKTIFQPSKLDHMYALKTLIVLHSVGEAVKALKNIAVVESAHSDSYSSSLPPFPKGMVASMLPLLRSSCTTIPCINGEIPPEVAPIISKSSQAATASQPQQLDSRHARAKLPALIRREHAMRLHNKRAPSTVESDITEAPSIKGNDELIAQVLSPDPRYKLILISTSIRVHNKLGFPLEICFLDADSHAAPIHDMHKLHAPISLLSGPHENNTKLEISTDSLHLNNIPSSTVFSTSIQNLDEVVYSAFLYNEHFLSVPKEAFLGRGHAVFCFRPLHMFSGNREPQDNNINFGWTNRIDTAKCTDTESRYSLCGNQHLFFRIKTIKSAYSSLTKTEITDVYIMPIITLINSIPTEISIEIEPELKRERNDLRNNITLLRHSALSVTSIYPADTFKLRVKFLGNENQWSSYIKTEASPEDSAATSITLPYGGGTEAEIEMSTGLSTSLASGLRLHPSQQCIIFSAPRWFIDRTGLNIRATVNGLQFPIFDGIQILGSPKVKSVKLEIPRGLSTFSRKGEAGTVPISCDADIPPLNAYSETSVTTPSRFYTFCVTTSSLDPEESPGPIARLICLLPRYIITNQLEKPIEIRQTHIDEAYCRVKPKHSVPVDWIRRTDVLGLDFRVGSNRSWSSSVIPCDATVGCTSISIKNGNSCDVYSVTVSASNGLISISISHPQENSYRYIFVNNCEALNKAALCTAHLSADRGNVPLLSTVMAFSPSIGEPVDIGWSHPYSYPSRLIFIDFGNGQIGQAFDLKNAVRDGILRINVMHSVLHISTDGNQKRIELKYASRRDSTLKAGNALTKEITMRFSLTLSHLGLSFISDALGEEVLYTELLQSKMTFSQVGGVQRVELVLSDIQSDCQLERAKMPVLLANRTSSIDGDRSKSSTANPFLHLYVVRPFCSSNDIVLEKFNLTVGDMEFSYDTEMHCGLATFFEECTRTLHWSSSNVHSHRDISKWLSHAIYTDFVAPALPTVLVIHNLKIESCLIVMWCSLVMSKVHLMSDSLRIGLTVVMASDKLELKGAPLSLPEVEFQDIRNTAPSIWSTLKDAYTNKVLASVFKILGYTSLLNVPKIPVKLGKNTIGAASQAVENFTVGLGGVLSSLSFDADYINARQKERMRSSGTTRMKDEFQSARRNLGEGVIALASFIQEPINSAKTEGVSGVLKGVGKGIIGSLVKPLDKLNQAVTDVSRGINAGMSSKSKGNMKERTKRRRSPRMMWGEMGEVRAYHAQDAELRRKLGLDVVKNILKFIIVNSTHSEQSILLVYPRKISLISWIGSVENHSSSEKAASRTVWEIAVSAISTVHTTTHGVLIRTDNRCAQIPSDSAAVMQLIYKEITESQRKIQGVLRIQRAMQ